MEISSNIQHAASHGRRPEMIPDQGSRCATEQKPLWILHYIGAHKGKIEDYSSFFCFFFEIPHIKPPPANDPAGALWRV
jgi:hypothetical protein